MTRSVVALAEEREEPAVPLVESAEPGVRRVSLVETADLERLIADQFRIQRRNGFLARSPRHNLDT
jgi:hypothetical protein